MAKGRPIYFIRPEMGFAGWLPYFYADELKEKGNE